MPNHISHIVSLRQPNEDEHDYDAMKQLEVVMRTDDSPFDFNVLVPYPEEWDVLDKAWHEGMKAGVPMSKLPPDGYNRGGYQWCISNWGTKWNAYDIVFEYGDLTLCAAWSTPKPIWVALSKRFPEFDLHIKYADEDIGSNCGILIYRNGVLIHDENDESLPDPELFAHSVVYYQRSDWHWKEYKQVREELDALKRSIALQDKSLSNHIGEQ